VSLRTRQVLHAASRSLYRMRQPCQWFSTSNRLLKITGPKNTYDNSVSVAYNIVSAFLLVKAIDILTRISLSTVNPFRTTPHHFVITVHTLSYFCFFLYSFWEFTLSFLI